MKHECDDIEKKHYVLLALSILVVIAVTLSITLSLKGNNDDKPHVVLVIADDMGYNDIGYHNQFGDIRTPYLDKMAKEGLRLDRYYGQSICTPARAALFTGRYPYRYGLQGARPILYGAKEGLPTSEKHLLPQVLKDGGYNTFLVGKWHLGYSKWDYTPVKRGFDYFYGMYGGFADYLTHESAEAGSDLKAFDLHEHRAEDIEPDGSIKETNEQSADLIAKTYGVYSEKLFTDKATQIIEEHNLKGGHPLFLTVSYMNPHSPLQVLPEDLQKVPANVTNDIRRKFSALMSSLDMGVHQIADALKRKGMYDDTIFIFTGDNGGAIQGPIESRSLGGTNWPLRGSKWTIYEGGVRVPAFVRGPGIKPGKSTDQLFHITDWLPTLANLARVKPKMELDGVDQKDFLVGEVKESPRHDVVLELDPAYQQAALIRGNYKLIVGDPAPKPYHGVYKPLTGDATWYFDNTDYTRSMFDEAKQRCYEKVSTYLKNLLKPDFLFRNMSNIGEFDKSTIQLYDLESDPGEQHDLFAGAGRMETLAREMYDILKERCRDMAPLTFFGGKFRDVEAAYKTISLDSPVNVEGEVPRTKINKWTPWLS